MKGLFLDAVDDLAEVFARVVRPDDPPVTVNEQEQVRAGGSARDCSPATISCSTTTPRCRPR